MLGQDRQCKTASKAPDAVGVACGTRQKKGRGTERVQDLSWPFRVGTCLGPLWEGLGWTDKGARPAKMVQARHAMRSTLHVAHGIRKGRCTEGCSMDL